MVTSSPGGTILLRAISYSRRNGDVRHHFESCLQQALFLLTDYSFCGSVAAADGAAAADNQ